MRGSKGLVRGSKRRLEPAELGVDRVHEWLARVGRRHNRRITVASSGGHGIHGQGGRYGRRCCRRVGRDCRLRMRAGVRTLAGRQALEELLGQLVQPREAFGGE